MLACYVSALDGTIHREEDLMKRLSRVLAMIVAATLLLVGAGELITSVQAKTKKVKKTKKRKAKKGAKLAVATAGVAEHAMLKTIRRHQLKESTLERAAKILQPEHVHAVYLVL